jgi:Dyp-type peroxidase family
MAFDLNRTISLEDANRAGNPQDAETLAMLSELQGNILKGHGRDATVNLFLSFEGLDVSSVRAFVANIGGQVTTALDQLVAAREFRQSQKDGGTFRAFFLSALGYEALGLTLSAPPDPAFRAGMKARKSELNDPEVGAWDKHLSGPVGAMLLLADDNAERLAAAAYQAESTIATAGVKLLGTERGLARRNSDGQGIEHFGYVDGRSQPLVLSEDIQKEKDNGGTDKWDPTVQLRQALIVDPNGKLDVSLGSYFVFRKLEQNVKGFKSKEMGLAEHLKLQTNDEERAGASVVGRFENGTPVIASDVEVPVVGQGPLAVPNNFNYTGDVNGFKCPYAGHIRKTNPRRSETQIHLMLRRGITYGQRADDPNDGKIDNKPERDVGLLFMSYQSNLLDQFEFTQKLWADNAAFDINSPIKPIGIDPVIGQLPPGGSEPGQLYPDKWGVSHGQRFDFHGFVHMKGGEYFFAPSISFLKDPGRVASGV